MPPRRSGAESEAADQQGLECRQYYLMPDVEDRLHNPVRVLPASEKNADRRNP